MIIMCMASFSDMPLSCTALEAGHRLPFGAVREMVRGKFQYRDGFWEENPHGVLHELHRILEALRHSRSHVGHAHSCKALCLCIRLGRLQARPGATESLKTTRLKRP